MRTEYRAAILMEVHTDRINARQVHLESSFATKNILTVNIYANSDFQLKIFLPYSRTEKTDYYI